MVLPPLSVRDAAGAIAIRFNPHKRIGCIMTKGTRPSKRRRTGAAANDDGESGTHNTVVSPAVVTSNTAAPTTSGAVEQLNVIASQFHTMRVEKSTINGYSSKVRGIKKFFSVTEGMDRYLKLDGEILLPLQENVIRPLFAWLAVNPDLSRSKADNPETHGEEDEADDDDDDAMEPAPFQVMKVTDARSRTNPRKRGRRRNKNEESSDDESSDDDDDEPADYGFDGFDAATVMAANIATMSASCMQGYKSALLWYYDEMKVAMDDKTNHWLDEFVAAYKKYVARKKQNGVMKLTEGKTYIQFQDYITLSKVMTEQLLLCNNLISLFHLLCRRCCAWVLQ